MKTLLIALFFILNLHATKGHAEIRCERKEEPQFIEPITFAEDMGQMLSLELPSAQPIEIAYQDPDAAKYRTDLEKQSERTLSLLESAGLHDLVEYTQMTASTDHLVSDYGSSGHAPANFNEFKAFGNNQDIISLLSQDISSLHFDHKANLINGSMYDPSLADKNIGRTYLTYDEAQKLINESKTISATNIAGRGITGACFLRSSHISHELSKKYAHVPALKLWATGEMAYGDHKWPYHTITMVPVVDDPNIIVSKDSNGRDIFLRKTITDYRTNNPNYHQFEGSQMLQGTENGRIYYVERVTTTEPVKYKNEIQIRYMALDTELAHKGPMKIEEWSKYFVDNGLNRAVGPVDLQISTTDRLSPSRPNCNYANVDKAYPQFWEALDSADKGVVYTPSNPIREQKDNLLTRVGRNFQNKKEAKRLKREARYRGY